MSDAGDSPGEQPEGHSGSEPGGGAAPPGDFSNVADYLVESAEVDWAAALVSWRWLLPDAVTVWLVNSFGEPFLVTADGAVHRLDVEGGTLDRLAASRDEFCDRIDAPGVAEEWLHLSDVDRLRANGLTLRRGQCYGFTLPLILKPASGAGRCVPIAVADYVGSRGSLHEQLRDVPDGTTVRLATS